jgi:hypothetical protein
MHGKPAPHPPRYIAAISHLRAIAESHFTSGRLYWHGGPPSYRKDGVVVDPAAASVVVKYHDSLSSSNQRLFESMVVGSKGRFLAACALASKRLGRPVTVS